MYGPAAYNLDLYRGDSATYNFVFWDDAEHTLPSDLTGVTARAQVRDMFNGTLLIETHCAIVLPNTVQMDIERTDWQYFPRRDRGVWDLQLMYPDTTVSTMLRGNVAFISDVTE